MNLEKYTQKAQEAILAAQAIARDHHQAAIEPAHLLLALAQQPEGIVPAILTRIAGSPNLLISDLQSEIRGLATMTGAAEQPGLSRGASAILEDAERRAVSMKDDYVSTEHLLLALAAGPESERLSKFGLTPDAILRALATISRLAARGLRQSRGHLSAPGKVRPRSHATRAVRASSTRSSAGTRRSAGWFRSFHGAPRTTLP